MFSQTETDFNLDRHLISFLQDSPFFAELSRHIRKVPTKDMPTAAVAYDEKLDDLTMYWNPDFFSKLETEEIRGVLLHEFYHLVFCHLTHRRKTPPKMWNVATDLAINSVIVGAGRSSGGKPSASLPQGALIPGVFPLAVKDRKPTKEELAASPIGALIASFPTDQSSEWYFDKLKEKVDELKKNGGGKCPVHGKGKKNEEKGGKNPDGSSGGEKNEGTDGSSPDGQGHGHGESDEQCTCGSDPFGDLDSLDDHSTWDDVPEDIRDLVAAKVSATVEAATKHADSQANGWGDMPSELRDAIRKSVSRIVDWRLVLKQFVGGLLRGSKATTMKRINKRYPYIHPGTKRGYTAKLLIAIDQSGSVDNDQLAMFFSELGQLTKRTSVTILPFDCYADEKDLFEWKKGTNPELKRVRGGGTDFDAPTRLANDPRNRGRWDGMLILTDGECNAPGPSRMKRGWVVSRGRKLLFPTDEITITLDPETKKSGPWR